MIRGGRLKKGDLVRVIAPAGPFERDHFLSGVERLRAWGLEPVWREDVFAVERYLAGSDARRGDELIEAFTDQRAKAVFCARGGHGSMRILDAVDDAIIRANPKPVIGYSDNSALLLDLFFRIGLAGIHGPMIAGLQWATISPENETWYRRLLFDADPPGRMPNFGVRRVRGGVGEGRLLPCNLTLLIHSLAAGRIGDLSDAILVIEDVDEAAYRVDRMLNVLRLAGVFDKIRGLVFGSFEGVAATDLAVIIDDFSPHFRFPVLAGAPVGHGEENVPIPVGVRARIDADGGVIDVLESPVC